MPRRSACSAAPQTGACATPSACWTRRAPTGPGGSSPAMYAPSSARWGESGCSRLLEAVVSSDAAAMIVALDRLAGEAADFEMLLGEVVDAFGRMAALQVVPAGREDDEEIDALRALAVRISPEALQLHYQIGILGRRDLPWAPHPRVGFEMTMLRMVAFAPASGAAADSEGGVPMPGAAPAPAPAAAREPETATGPPPGEGCESPRDRRDTGALGPRAPGPAPSGTGARGARRRRGAPLAVALGRSLRAPRPQRHNRTARGELRGPRAHRIDGRSRPQPGTRAAPDVRNAGQARVRARRLLRPADTIAGRRRSPLGGVAGRTRRARKTASGSSARPGNCARCRTTRTSSPGSRAKPDPYSRRTDGRRNEGWTRTDAQAGAADAGEPAAGARGARIAGGDGERRRRGGHRNP